MRHAVLLAGFVACASSGPMPHPEPKVALTPPSELCGDRSLNAESFCLDAARLERLLAREDCRVLEYHGPGRGTTDIQIVTLEVAARGKKLRFRAKWKPSAEMGEGFNNQPRKELAAHELQKLFLEPHEYVVPPTTV